MKKIERNDFISKSSVVLGSILDQINNLPILNIKDLDPDRTVMVIIDMINGFTREGALSSARSEAVIPHICALGKYVKSGVLENSHSPIIIQVNHQNLIHTQSIVLQARQKLRLLMK